MVDGTSPFDAAERARIDRALADANGPAALREPLAYALAGGGKRFRGLLVLEAFRTCGGRGDALDLAVSVEAIHAYSLVHDDLPCMDNDDLRRGRPTLHKVFGVCSATVVGCAMIPLAGVFALRGARQLGLDARDGANIVRELMRAAGSSGMVGGQQLDLEGDSRPATLDELERTHRAKTGALIEASVVIGALGARASRSQIEALRAYGRAIGLAFQVADDLLDITASPEQLGKNTGRDAERGKSTYPTLLGAAEARAFASRLVAEGVAAAAAGGVLSDRLAAVGRYALEREH